MKKSPVIVASELGVSPERIYQIIAELKLPVERHSRFMLLGQRDIARISKRIKRIEMKKRREAAA